MAVTFRHLHCSIICFKIHHKRMKKTIYTLGFLLLIILSSCHYRGSVTDAIFNGEIRYIDDSQKQVMHVTARHLPLEGQYHGSIAVFDSLLICSNPRLPNYNFNVFNIDTGEEIGSFLRRGVGPQDAVSAQVDQLFKRENDLMALVLGINENRLFVWNITQSVQQGVAVFDTIVEHSTRSYRCDRLWVRHIFFHTDSTLFAYVQGANLDFEGALVTTPFYEKRTLLTNELLGVYSAFTQDTVRRRSSQSPQSRNSRLFFFSNDAMKPDGSKIVQAMTRIPQINIIDTHTGEVVGYRQRGGRDFSNFNSMRDQRIFYSHPTTNNQFIFTTYARGVSREVRPIRSNVIHVFDWYGRLWYELRADRDFFQHWLCPVRNRLYTMCGDSDEVYYLDLNELNLRTPE